MTLLLDITAFAVVISRVDWSKRMNSFSRMVLVLYCVVLSIIPLSNLHVEDLLPDTNLLTNQSHQEIDLLVLIHEALFTHLCNITDHLYRAVDRMSDYLTDQTSERLFPDVMALKPCLMSLALLAYAFYAARRYLLKRSSALPQTTFCYQLFDHSPPSLTSL